MNWKSVPFSELTQQELATIARLRESRPNDSVLINATLFEVKVWVGDALIVDRKTVRQQVNDFYFKGSIESKSEFGFFDYWPLINDTGDSSE